MPVKALNITLYLFNRGIIGTIGLPRWVVMLNGGGFLTALHEIAQVYVGKQLFELGRSAILEYKISPHIEADVVSGIEAWEVKGASGSAKRQVNIYQSVGHLIPGHQMQSLEGIYITEKIKMMLVYVAPGEVRYYLYRIKENEQKERVSVHEVRKEFIKEVTRTLDPQNPKGVFEGIPIGIPGGGLIPAF